ncbi:MAG: SDR family oxidoreductase [Hyphomicrobiaceae bacterium]
MPNLIEDRSWAGKVVVVTGASAGVGRATARLFSKRGASVGLIARDAKALDATRDELRAVGGGPTLAISADVADADAIRNAASEIENSFGPIDVWVNNAMATVFSPVSAITPQEFRRVTEVTYLGAVHGTMAALRSMRQRNRGVIVQVGSALAYRSIPLQAAYCGAKHAIRGFTDSLRCELLHDNSNIQVVMVQLPAVNTPQFDWARAHLDHTPRPAGPVLQPEAVARRIVEAAARPTREVWLGASTLQSILGNIVMPSVLDRLLSRRAYGGQLTDHRISPSRADNLTTPVNGLHRSRGSFADAAAEWDWALTGRQARTAVGVLLAAGLAAAFMSGRHTRQRPLW